MLLIFMPIAFSARTADSRPGPGPLMRTSMFLTPHSCAARPARSAAICAANGVDLREPLKPALPEVAHESALPWRSVIVMIVLLKEACTWAMPSATFFFIFLRARAAVCTCCGFGILAIGFLVIRLVICYWARLALARRCFAGDGGLARSLASACIRARALPANRKSFAMAQAPIAAQVHQALDAHRDFAAQVAFHSELR